MNAPLLLKGAPGSPYTRKMLALLRYRRIPYALVTWGSPRLAAMPKPKVELLPTFYLHNAAGEIEAVTDSTPLIRRFEREFPARQVRPADPVLCFIDSLLEDYADEWLTKALFHYRWSFGDDIRKAGHILPLSHDVTAGDSAVAQQSAQFSQRQIGRLAYVGSSRDTAQVIEQSYLRFLDAFEAHLKLHPFVMGARPGASDFGIHGQLTQLANFDPTPSAITLARAPRVVAWVSLAEDLSGLEPEDGQWLGRDAIAATLITLLAEVGRVYVPLLLANARAVQSGAHQVRTQIDGQTYVQNPFAYQAKCLGWLREEFTALSVSDRQVVETILEQAGCGALVAQPL